MCFARFTIVPILLLLIIRHKIYTHALLPARSRPKNDRGILLKDINVFLQSTLRSRYTLKKSCLVPVKTGDVSFALSRWHKPYPSVNSAGIRMSSGGGENVKGGGFDELSTALARLDKQWQIKRRRRPKSGGWSKLLLDHPGKGRGEDTEYLTSSKAEPPPKQPTALPKAQEFVYLLEPSASSLPSSVILFLGGAGLGQFPHIAYSEFLRRISDRTGCAILAAPFEVGLDHFELAKKTETLFRKALSKCEDEKGWNSYLPKIALSHSLGAKLFTIGMAATGSGADMQGIGFLSFNNFGLADSIKMAGSFARDLRNSRVASATSGSPFEATMPSGSQGEQVIDFFLNLAEQATGLIGIDFTPSPADTERLIQMKFVPELQEKCRLFQFDNDELDCCERFIECCRGTEDDTRADVGRGPSISRLPGTHLTPVYVRVSLEDLDLPDEARDLANEATDFRSASFGSEKDMNAAVDEVCGWILGRPPTRGVGERQTKAALPGGAVDAEIA